MVSKEIICGRKPEKKKSKEKWKIGKSKSTANRSVGGEDRIQVMNFENFRIMKVRRQSEVGGEGKAGEARSATRPSTIRGDLRRSKSPSQKKPSSRILIGPPAPQKTLPLT